MDATEIKEIIKTYFDASFESNGAKIKEAFHEAAHIYGVAPDGSLIDMDRDTFKNLVDSDKTPGSPAFPREDEIVSIDFTGENTALARVKLRVESIRFSDMLCFVRLNGKWGIISKVFSGVEIRA